MIRAKARGLLIVSLFVLGSFLVRTPVQAAPPALVSAIGRGDGHVCAVMTAGGITCWGDNFLGDLGDGTTVQRNRPVDVVGVLGGAEVVAGGEGHTCAVVNGGVKCWGENNSGQLGIGVFTTHSPTPQDAIGLGTSVESVVADGDHTCALTNAGGVKCWGANGSGQLGRGNAGGGEPTPADVSGLSTGVAMIAAGAGHTCAVTNSGGAKCWGSPVAVGDNDGGQTSPRTRPVDVFGLTSGVSSIAAGGAVSCAVMLDGSVKCWGVNDRGQLGNGSTSNYPPAYAPVDVVGITNAIAVATGGHHTCAIRLGGALECWGANEYGQLGDGTAVDRSSPVGVLGLSSGVQEVAIGRSYTCALLSDGTVKCWGRGESGQIGVGTTQNHWTPTDVQFVPPPLKTLQINRTGQGAVTSDDGDIDCGSTCVHTFDDSVVVKLTAAPASGWGFAGWGGVNGECSGTGECTVEMDSDRTISATFTHTQPGQLFSWGFNTTGQLGIGANSSVVDSSVPVPVSGLADVTRFALGMTHAVAVRSDGAVWAWGANGYGQLGDNSLTTRTSPVRSGALSSAVAVAAGNAHSLALDSAGHVWSWGSDAKGQLGNGAVGNSPSPSQIAVGPAGTVIEAIDAGAEFSLALDSAGQVWSWGDDAQGQLGNGASGSSQSPQQIAGLPPIDAIDAGGFFALALDASGHGWAWGADDFGQQGNGSASSTSVQAPATIAGLQDLDAISAGAVDAVALDASGVMWGWGRNDRGQIPGANPPDDVDSPVEVDAPANIAAVSAGTSTSAALLADGTVRMAGSNISGQLGDGSVSPRTGFIQTAVIEDVSAVTAGHHFSLAIADTIVSTGEQASGTVDPGEAVTTNPSGGILAPSDPIDTTVTSPVSGTITIAEEPVAGTPPAGYGLAGQEVTITAPAATPANPLIISFIVDFSHIPPGQSALTLQVFRNGALVPQCLPGSGANPDPCVASRQAAPSGDAIVTVRTSAASLWGLGFASDVSPPSAPLDLMATPGDGQAAVSWNPPADSGSDPVNGYMVTLSANGEDQSVSVDAGVTSTVLAGLTNETTYSTAVVATNEQGPGPAAGPVFVTPTASGPAFSVNDVSAPEGNAGTKNVKFKVSVSGPPSTSVTIKYQTQDGTATAGSDYVGVTTPKTLTLAAGQLSKSVSVQIVGDTVFETNETFSLLLSNPSFGTSIADDTGIATVVNDEPDPSCTLVGTPSNDTLTGTSGDDVICGLGGNDVIHGEAGNDRIVGEAGNDQLFGGPGDDQVEAGVGNDAVQGGAGDDQMSGGLGIDTLSYADAGSAPVTVSLQIIGTDQNTGAATGTDRLNDQGFETLIGASGADTLTGNDIANTIKGGMGNDRLDGLDGGDTLFGQGGNDALDGGSGAPDICNGGGGMGDSAVSSCETVTGVP